MPSKHSPLTPRPSPLRILVTNDDGINAPGLTVLEAIARKISDDIWVVAPEQEQSGAGHSLTLHNPVRVRKIEAKRFAISGTPTDCVLLAQKEILRNEKKPFDLVLSGVNRGSNAGDDVTYSGTVAAAMEATLLNIPAMALSLLFYDGKTIHWETAQKHAPAILKKLLKEGWPKGSFVNLNFPACTPDKVKGIASAAQGKRIMSVALTERADPRGRPYFWIGGDRDNSVEDAGVDIARLDAGFITVTPIQMDMTDYPTLARFGQLFKAK